MKLKRVRITNFQSIRDSTEFEIPFRWRWWRIFSGDSPPEFAWLMIAYTVIQVVDGNLVVPLLFSDLHQDAAQLLVRLAMLRAA